MSAVGVEAGAEPVPVGVDEVTGEDAGGALDGAAEPGLDDLMSTVSWDTQRSGTHKHCE